MSTWHELKESVAGKALGKVGFEPSVDHDTYIKVFGDSLLSLHVNKPGEMKGPRKMSEPVLLDIFDIHEPTPSMRLQFESVTEFLKSVYDHR